MRSRPQLGAVCAALTLTLTMLSGVGGAASAAGPDPMTPEYQARDAQNIADAYGRVTGENGQLQNPHYLPALVAATSEQTAAQLLEQAAEPSRVALTAGQVAPGWNVGNPLRAGWKGTRGKAVRVTFTNKYGALLRGTVWRPMPGAKDPYTGQVLRGPFPGVVITTGSVQGSEGMYRWLAQDLAERGYVVLTYDVQGQGSSETMPHQDGNAFPFCNPLDTPVEGEMTGCPGVPAQQTANFTVGTRNALSFFTSTPGAPYANPKAAGAKVTTFNPYWKLFDRRRDPRPFTPGRTLKIGIIGHSLGATAVSQVQEHDTRVAAVVALDKLAAGSNGFGDLGNTPVAPALGLQSEYGFSVSPWWLSGGSSLAPQPSPEGPDPMRERATGFEAWRKAGVDSMVVVPRASTHLDYTDIPLVLPASRYGQALSSRYTQAWLDHYLKHRDTSALLTGRGMRYLEPEGNGVWKPISLDRSKLLSFSYCSAYDFRQSGRRHADLDIAGVGCAR